MIEWNIKNLNLRDRMGCNSQDKYWTYITVVDSVCNVAHAMDAGKRGVTTDDPRFKHPYPLREKRMTLEEFREFYEEHLRKIKTESVPHV